jgi:hypothetical protein
MDARPFGFIIAFIFNLENKGFTRGGWGGLQRTGARFQML